MGTRLFVGNLPFDATEAQVRDLIAAGGRNVSAVKLVTDRDTGRPRGFAFVDLDTEEAAKAAIAELNGKDFGGRALVVNEAQEKAGGAGGGKFGGGGGGGGFRGTPHGKEGRAGGFGSRGPSAGPSRGGSRGGGRGGGRGS
jgi:cold-inducible RNA-binding protein